MSSSLVRVAGIDPLRIVRLLGFGGFVAACSGIVGLVCADRLAHPGALPLPRAAVAAVPEPSATGSIPTPPKAALPKPAPPAIPNGFDTERLHALMRGDPLLPRR